MIMSEIKIFMCCHKPFEIVPPLCTPIQCGSAVNAKIAGVLHDDDGENISSKNREYCELTAHYYAWKNVEADSYGFCHYRRFFCADESVKLPYSVKGKLSESDKKRLLKDDGHWKEKLGKYDMICPRSEDMGISAREHYVTSRYHYAEDLDLFIDILGKKSPDIKPFAENYLKQNRQYFCNMFVMKHDLFFKYCEILFETLAEFDNRKKIHGDFQSDRTDGFLGEIFTGIYINYCRENGSKILELPRLDIDCSLKKRLGCAVLPPESKRRFLVKKAVKNLKR